MKWIKIQQKPIEMKAFQLTESMLSSGELNDEPRIEGKLMGNILMFFINTLTGKVRARVGDWIIESPQGDIHPCTEKDFNVMFDYTMRYL